MNTLVIVVWVLIGMHLVALAFAPLLTPKDPPGREPRVDPCLGPVFGLPPDRPAASPVRGPCPDSVLQAQLFAGEISRDEYRSAMAWLAEKDEREHPVPYA